MERIQLDSPVGIIDVEIPATLKRAEIVIYDGIYYMQSEPDSKLYKMGVLAIAKPVPEATT